MAILHKNISAEGDIHNPKWFSGANNGDVAWRNELGVLESTDELVLPAALDFVDGSAAPPTSNSGDIYVLSSGASVNAGWGTVSLGDWVRYDGTTWNVITPQKSSLCYDEDSDTLHSYDGTTWVAIGGGGDSIYTADGTTGAGRVLTITDSLTLGHLNIDQSIFGNYSFIGTTTKNSNTGYNIAIYEPTGQMTINAPSGTNINFNAGNSIKGKLLSNGDWVFGGTDVIGTENICLKKPTAIKGIGTSGSSSLAIYDNDTTPNKLWDFLDNGNIIANENPNFKGVNASAYQLSFCRPVNIVNYGAGFSMDLLNSSGNQVSYGKIFSTIVSVTTGSEYGYVSISAMKNGTPTIISNFDSVDGLTINDVTSTNLFKAGNVLTVSKTDVTSKGGYIPLNVYQPVGVNNYGVGFEFNLNNSSGNKTAYGLINSVIVDSTSGSEDGKMNIQVKENGSLTTKMTLKTNTVNIPNLPTSATGLTNGDLWNDGGTLKIA